MRGLRLKSGIESTLSEACGQRKGYPEAVDYLAGLTGVVLAGGSGRRFGGDKPAALFEGRTLLARVVDALLSACERVVIVAGVHVRLPPLDQPVERLDDDFPGEGPLGGLLTAMRAVGQERIFAAGCDMPLLSSGTVRVIVAALDAHPAADAAVPVAEGRWQPLAAAYDVERCLPLLEAAFAHGERRLRAAVEGLRVVPVTDLADRGRSLVQVNTRADLAAVAAGHSRGRGSEIPGRG
jgi:molybdopterin-guanine dinucleotide biosynthesis protein A